MTTQIITIDGPVASGKGTVASMVAKELGFDYLDSGALYRLLALSAQEQRVDLGAEADLADLAGSMQIRFADDGKVYLNDQDVTQAIRAESIGIIASQIASLPGVRNALLDRQRQFSKKANLVADGRDMGSVVFPEAQLKVYLFASVEERAKRRAKQIGVGENSSAYQQIYQNILARDERDLNRKVAPLVPALDARSLDCSQLGIVETVKKIINWYQEVTK